MLAGQLRDDPRFALAGTAGHQAALLHVLHREGAELVVIDDALPPQRAIAAIAAILARHPRMAIVVLADVDDDPSAPDAALAALRCGACGYLDRRLRPAALAAALVGVAHGEPALSRRLTMALLTRLIQMPPDDGGSGLRPVRSSLTDREWEVLDLLGAGLSTTQIAEQLVISVDTVRSHVKRILRKLEVHRREDAILAARQLRHPR